MTTQTIPALTPVQARTVQAAREALARPHDHDAAGLAYRVGVIEWHLGELLALVGQLIGDE